jgi:hypothetical protein
MSTKPMRFYTVTNVDFSGLACVLESGRMYLLFTDSGAPPRSDAEPVNVATFASRAAFEAGAESDVICFPTVALAYEVLEGFAQPFLN